MVHIWKPSDARCNGVTSLHLASDVGYVQVVGSFSNTVHFKETRDKYDCNPLERASIEEHVDAVRSSGAWCGCECLVQGEGYAIAFTSVMR